ncbi:MAG: immunoglobulin domain-containing protein [Verrucomicrobiota bacterium]
MLQYTPNSILEPLKGRSMNWVNFGVYVGFLLLLFPTPTRLCAQVTVAPQQLASIGIAGMPIEPKDVSFTAPLPTAWSLTIAQPWLSASITNGMTPSSLVFCLNSTNLGSGLHTNQLTITANGNSQQLSFVLQLHDLNVLKLVPDPSRDYIYALDPGTGTNDDAFLLFLNTDSGIVEKVIPIGINPTDMSINRFEDRLYVSNWEYDQTPVVDLQSQAELPPISINTDVYKVSGGIAGHIVVEGENQWIEASLIDTTNGATIAAVGLIYEGDGTCDPTGRYYFHVEDDIDASGIRKYDIGNSQFDLVANGSSHFPWGSRNLVMSLDGSRLFWTGAMFDSNLVDFGTIGNEVYSSSTNGSIAFSSNQAIDTAAKAVIYDLPTTSTVQAVDRRDQRLWYFNNADSSIESLPMATIRRPSITQPSTNIMVAAGGIVNLAVEPGGLNPLSYQWCFQNTNLVGATNSSLILNNIQFAESGNYSVIVSNVFGMATGEVAQVAVLSAPYVVNQPSIVNVAANSNVTIYAGPIAVQSLNYQWLFDGIAIANATNSSLNIPHFQLANDGYYQVIVSNNFGTTTSSPIVMRVVPSEAAVVSGPTSISIAAGAQAVFNASILGSAPLTMQWYKDGALIPGNDSPQLVITNAQAANAGSYQLLVSNLLGTAVSTSATLTVLPSKPSFVVQPTSQSTCSLGDISFQSLAMGSDDAFDPILYHWYFQGNEIPAQTGATLSVRAVNPTNEGSYYVMASNALGTATSAVVQLMVYQAPSFQIGLSNLVVGAGESIMLMPVANGTPPLAYSWAFNISQLTNTSPTLCLTDVARSLSGFYSVTVSNQCGSISSTGRVSVCLPESQIVAWGDDSCGQTDVPTNVADFVAIAGGGYHTVTIRRNGTLMAWGADEEGQTDVPTNSLPFVSIAAGAYHNVAIAGDGRVAAWGDNDSGQIDVPNTVVSALSVAAGESHSLALLASGVVVAWGDDTYGQTNLPSQMVTGYFADPPSNSIWMPNPNWMPVQSIAAGRNHSLALLTNGTVVAWGDNSFGQASPPSDLVNVVGIAAGDLHSAALCSDGTVVVWGDDTFGQTNLPAGLSNIVAIAAGDFHTYALGTNGSVIGWGDNTFGQLNVPPNATSAVTLASGYYHGLALSPVVQLIRFQSTQNGLKLNWNGPGILQWAATPIGPFTDAPLQSNPWTNLDMSSPARFFRTRH